MNTNNTNNTNNWKVGAGELGVQIQSGLYEIISQMKAKIINTSKKNLQKYKQIEMSVKEIEITKMKKKTVPQNGRQSRLK